MKANAFAPRKLDMGAFIASGEALSGDLTVTELPRLASGLSPEVDVATLPAITWSAQGRQVAQRLGEPQLWLDLSAQAELAWECQRCLHPVTERVTLDLSIRFAKDEAAAVALDADLDEDVLALSRQFDLIELIEDELIMAQPIVPRHARCPTDVAALMSTGEDDVRLAAQAEQAAAVAGATSTPDEVPLTASGRPNPFAALAALKKKPTQ